MRHVQSGGREPATRAVTRQGLGHDESTARELRRNVGVGRKSKSVIAPKIGKALTVGEHLPGCSMRPDGASSTAGNARSVQHRLKNRAAPIQRIRADSSPTAT